VLLFQLHVQTGSLMGCAVDNPLTRWVAAPCKDVLLLVDQCPSRAVVDDAVPVAVAVGIAVTRAEAVGASLCLRVVFLDPSLLFLHGWWAIPVQGQKMHSLLVHLP
jgi:hypothetical protein